MSKKSKFSGLLSQAVEQKASQEFNVRNHITIVPELKALIPPLSTEELVLLENSILSEGCREAIILWDNNGSYVLVDGHNRYQICQKHQLEFKFEIKQFDSLEDVKNWMINNQLGKRNLTEQQKSYLRGIRYQNEKKGVGGSGKNQYSNDDNLTTLRTTEKLADLYQVSPKTIERDAKFATGLNLLVEENNDLKHQILTKQVKVPAGVVQKLADVEGEELENLKLNIQKSYIELEKQGKKETKTPQNDIKKKVLNIINNMTETELEELFKALNKK
jgi:hypothetical protein